MQHTYALLQYLTHNNLPRNQPTDEQFNELRNGGYVVYARKILQGIKKKTMTG